MSDAKKKGIIGITIGLVLGAAVAYPTQLQLYAFVSFLIQWVVALFHAIPKQDETLFDLTGSFTFAIVSTLGYRTASHPNWRIQALTGMVFLWCVRLGSFLFLRIREAGCDSRFEKIRGEPLRFLATWTLQGLWVVLTLLAVLLSDVHALGNKNVTILDITGISFWLIGYIIEAVADYQKTLFRKDSKNKGKFISSGLWYYSRHPNYFGEILMWFSIFLVCVHDLPNIRLQATAFISPVFVAFLLTKVSGIPLLEKAADKKWGNLKTYQEYKRTTSVLILLPKHG